MAETFAFNVQAPVQQQGPLGPAAAAVGATGNMSAPQVSQPGGIQANDSGMKTLAALQKMGQEVLAPFVQAEKQRMMMDGLVAGLQGISAAQIKDDELLGMFGDSITVSAARQVEKMDAVNKFSIDLASRMPELREMDPNSFRSWLPKQLEQYSTGDTQSDALITEAFVERLPQTIEMHTKEHISYRQEVAERAWSNDLNTSGAALSGDSVQARRGTLSPDNLIRSQQQFVSRLGGPGGINSAVYPKWINKAYKRFAADGNIAALAAIEASGVLDSTQSDDEMAALRKQRDIAESKDIVRNVDLAELAGDRGAVEALIDYGSSKFGSVAEVVAWARGVDAEAMAISGGSKPIYGEPGYARLAESFVKGLQREQERGNRAAGSKDDAGAVQRYIALIKQKSTHLAWGLANMPPETRRLAQDWVYKNDPQAIEHAAADDEKWPAVETDLAPLKLLITRGETTPELQRSMQVARRLAMEAGDSGLQVLGRYLGDKAPNALMFLERSVGVDDPEKFSELLKQSRPWIDKPPADVDASGIESYLDAEFSKGAVNTVSSVLGFGGSMEHIGITEEGRKLFTQLVTPEIARAQVGTARGVEQAAQVGLAQWKGMIDFAMGIPVTGNKLVTDPSRKTFSAAVNALVPKDRSGNKVGIDPFGQNYQRAMTAVLKEKLKAFEGHDSFWSPPEATSGVWTGSTMELEVLVAGQPRPVTVTPAEVLDALRTVQAAQAVQGNISRGDVFTPHSVDLNAM